MSKSVADTAKIDEFQRLGKAQEDTLRRLMDYNRKIISSTEALKKASGALAETPDSEVFQSEVLRLQEDITRISAERDLENQLFCDYPAKLAKARKELLYECYHTPVNYLNEEETQRPGKQHLNWFCFVQTILRDFFQLSKQASKCLEYTDMLLRSSSQNQSTWTKSSNDWHLFDSMRRYTLAKEPTRGFKILRYFAADLFDISIGCASGSKLMQTFNSASFVKIADEHSRARSCVVA
jgi:hypothetical protein